MEIYLAKTQGFCSGVTYAINIVESVLSKYGLPLYVYHEIVHNTYVVENFRKQGVIFVESLKDVPLESRVIFSAHGVPPSIIDEAQERELKIIDATCPLVTKVHKEAVKFSKQGYHVILIGNKGHQETIGTSGYVNPDLLHIIERESDIDKLKVLDDSKIAYITQTTLSVDESKSIITKLKSRFPNIEHSSSTDLCYATQVRQNAVKELAKTCDIIVICGSPNSSNSNRLKETGERHGVESYIVDNADEFDIKLVKNKNKIGISSGASVPRVIVDCLIDKIANYDPDTIIYGYDNLNNDIVFKIPEI